MFILRQIYAEPRKMKILRLTDLPDVWTSDISATSVRVVPIFHLNFKRMASFLAEARAKYDVGKQNLL